MHIRFLSPQDYTQIKEIYDKHFSHLKEFDFVKGFETAFVVIDDIDGEEKIITAGGIKLIPEMIAVSNLDCSLRQRLTAYVMLLEACRFFSGKLEKNDLFAFAQGDEWINTLKKIGFKEPSEQCLKIEI